MNYEQLDKLMVMFINRTKPDVKILNDMCWTWNEVPYRCLLCNQIFTEVENWNVNFRYYHALKHIKDYNLEIFL